MNDPERPPSRRHLSRQTVVNFFTHLICITILFVLPEVLMSISGPQPHRMPAGIYLKSLVFVTVFYLNYYVIIDRTLGQPRGWVKFTLSNVVLIALVLVVLYFVGRYLLPKRMDHQPHIRETLTAIRAASFLLRDLVMIVLTIALSVAIRLSDRWIRLERRRQEEKTTRREEELNRLKSQLNPHFLFNTLNSIYALIAISPDKAQKAVHELSRLLRYMLYDNHSTVTLRQELEFIDNYVRLMRLRIPESTPISLTLDAGNDADMPIAPLMFINIVENMFKHGITLRRDCPLEISVTAHDGVVTCITTNHIAPSEPGREQASQGIGISNLRRRLDLLYGSNASLASDERDGLFRVKLIINLNHQ